MIKWYKEGEAINLANHTARFSKYFRAKVKIHKICEN